jgi:hypothetical protein
MTTNLAGSRAGRQRLALGLVALAASLVSGCADLSSTGDSSTSSAVTGGSTVSSTAATGGTAAGTCPDVSASLEAINAATYAVYGEAIVNVGAGPELVHFQVGTAWAADRRLLVSNAHVTQAFAEFAQQGLQLERAIAVQAGTGNVVTILRELTHPDYDGDPIRSPDVGLLTTQEELPSTLEMAADDVAVALGDEIQIVGFPGDVTDFIEIVPGETVPQATSLSGQITALRTHDDTEAVTQDNLDVIQHQAPTTPGTSGSSIVRCGKVIGVNNAGTVNLIAIPAADGSLTIDRQSAAANNFGVHVRYIRELVGLLQDNALPGTELPAEAAVVNQPQEQPIGFGLTLNGQVEPPYQHTFVVVLADDNTITGESSWAEGVNRFALSGQLFDDGSAFFIDDAPETSDFARGFYEGEVVNDTTIEGIYYEEGDEGRQASFVAAVQ